MDGYSSRYDCRWIILQRKASEIVKHIRPFSGQLGNKKFHQCLHSRNLILEELKEKNKKGSANLRQFSWVPSTISSSSRLSGRAKRWSSFLFLFFFLGLGGIMMAKDKIKIGKFSQMTYYLLREIFSQVLRKIGDDVKTVTCNLLIS